MTNAFDKGFQVGTAIGMKRRPSKPMINKKTMRITRDGELVHPFNYKLSRKRAGALCAAP